MSDPPGLGDGVRDEGIQGLAIGGDDLGGVLPYGPTLVVNGDMGARCKLHSSKDVGPVALGKCIHFAIQVGKTAMGVFLFPVLVTIDMLELPRDRGLL